MFVFSVSRGDVVIATGVSLEDDGSLEEMAFRLDEAGLDTTVWYRPSSDLEFELEDAWEYDPFEDVYCLDHPHGYATLASACTVEAF